MEAMTISSVKDFEDSEPHLKLAWRKSEATYEQEMSD